MQPHDTDICLFCLIWDRWFNSNTLLELGLMYATGRNGELDFVAAHKWFNLAVYRGCEAAKSHRDNLAVKMSKSQIAQAQRAAREWIAKH